MAEAAIQLQVYLLSVNGGSTVVTYSWSCPDIVTICRDCAEYACENGGNPVCDGSEDVICEVTKFLFSDVYEIKNFLSHPFQRLLDWIPNREEVVWHFE